MIHIKISFVSSIGCTKIFDLFMLIIVISETHVSSLIVLEFFYF
jgi:hypothetical protein